MISNRGRSRWAIAVAVALSISTATASAGDGPVSCLLPSWLNPFQTDYPSVPSQPLPMREIANWVDCVGERIRDDGIVTIKQPDVYSQARMTKYRKDFETEMHRDLDQFKVVLAARINRLDAATTTSTTTLGAALGPPGTTQVMAPTPTAPTFFGQGASLENTKSAFSEIKPVGMGVSAMGVSADLGLGLEPTIYLDQKKRFLDHLNQIRRLNLGPDQNDSSGYGLYLVRLPVSITPGECTYHGHGADLAVTVEHEFGTSFLPSTIRNLVVNDVVDQLGPVVYQIIRSEALKGGPPNGFAAERLRLEKERLKLQELLAKTVFKTLVDKMSKVLNEYPPNDDFYNAIVQEAAAPFAYYILRRSPSGKELASPDASFRDLVPVSIADRLQAMLDAIKLIGDIQDSKAKEKFKKFLQEYDKDIKELTLRIPKIRSGEDDVSQVDFIPIKYIIAEIIFNFFDEPIPKAPNRVAAQNYIDRMKKFVDSPNQRRRVDSRDDVVKQIILPLYKAALPDDVRLLDDATGLSPAVQARASIPLAQDRVVSHKINAKIKEISRSLPSTRNPKQTYPISAREVPDFFLPENLITLAEDAQKAMITKTPRAIDVRSYLRQSLYVAFDAMSKPIEPTIVPPLLDQALMDQILQAVLSRRFNEGQDGENSLLGSLKTQLLFQLEQTQSNIAGRPIGALCWAVAIDAVLLDVALREDVQKVLSDHGQPCPDLSQIRFYIPTTPDVQATFEEYVRLKWPILTFAIDPVVDQQNIADTFNLKRDLQLALSFAFATGQVNFNQVNTFRRQLEQESDAIALNRTVSGYAHGENTFGFRFTPRFQNPPNQRTNIGVIASQLISGGPGPDYGTKKSKLEPGMRELNAVVLVPAILPTVRMDVTGNWFKLTDPEHLIVPTRRMLEQGRKVQALKQAVACNPEDYRPDDLHTLMAKIQQLDAILPMQSRVVQVPFENTATGFELFSEGVTALVPELTGFDGVDVVPEGIDAEIFVFGRYFSIHETKVIVGGVTLTTPDQFDIISREVLDVKLPSAAIKTVTEDGKDYLEVLVATPAGISNRLLVPFQPKQTTPPTPPLAYMLSPDTNALNVAYQWLPDADGKTQKLVASKAPAPDPIKITWDDGTGIAARTLRAQFDVKFDDTRTVPIVLTANGKGTNDYEVDAGQFVACLLSRINQAKVINPPAVLPATMTATVSVRPEAGDYRIRDDFKKLDGTITINFTSVLTGVDALAKVKCPDTSGDPKSIPSDSPANSANPANQKPTTAYQLADDSKSIDVTYQWLNPNDPKAAKLIASKDPGKDPLKVTWDDLTGIAPKAVRVQFEVPIEKGPTLTFELRGNGGLANDYVIDRQQLVACLMSRAQNAFISPAALPASVKAVVSVRPEAGDYRIKTPARMLADPLVINFHNEITNDDVLQHVPCPDLPNDLAPAGNAPSVKPQASTTRALGSGGTGTVSMGRLSKAQGQDVEVRPAAMQLPVPPVVEDAAKALTGQPVSLPGNLVPKPPSSVGTVALPPSAANLASAVAAKGLFQTAIPTAEVAKVLSQAGIPTAEVAKGLFQAGTPTADVVKGLFQVGIPAAEVVRLLSQAGIPTAEVAKGLFQAGIPTAEVMQLLSQAGIPTAEVVKALIQAGAPPAGPQPATPPVVVTPPSPTVVVVSPQQGMERRKKPHPLSRLFKAGKSLGQSAAAR